MATKTKPTIKAKEFEELATQVRRLFHRLKAIGEEIHQLGQISASHRAVLECLYRKGPQTVPAMARARPVSRQHIQKLVNALLDEELVTVLPNPGHKKSSLISLTAKGRKLFESMHEKEMQILSQLRLPVGTEDIRGATETLKRLINYFEGPDWILFLKTFGTGK